LAAGAGMAVTGVAAAGVLVALGLGVAIAVWGSALGWSLEETEWTRRKPGGTVRFLSRRATSGR
jgi:hypothetical protein